MANQRLLPLIDYSEFRACNSLEELLSCGSNSIFNIEDSKTIYLDPPRDFGNLIQTYLDKPREEKDNYPEIWWDKPIVSPPSYAIHLKNPIVYGGRINRRNIPKEFALTQHEGGQLLLTEDYQLVPDSYLRYRSLPVDLLDIVSANEIYLRQDPGPLPTEKGQFFFIGNFSMDHFGHMIIEGLARLWPAIELDLSQYRLVVYQSELNSDALQYLEALHIPVENIYFLNQPTQFESLIVPSSPYLLHRQNSSLMDQLWRKIGSYFPPVENGPSKIYISRSRFKNWRNLANEEEVERLFSERGFEIVHPQELSLGEQISLMRSPEYVAACTGSGTYSCAFSDQSVKQFIMAPHTFVFRDDPLITYFKGGRTDYFLSGEIESDERGPRYPDWSIRINELEPAIDAWLES